MWLRRFISAAHPKCHYLIPLSVSNINRIFKSSLPSCRCISNGFLLSNKSQYVYDPDTDSFIPKSQITKMDNKKDHKNNHRGNFSESDQNEFEKPGFKTYLKRFSRNLFLITGAIVWAGVTFVSLFVDIHETSELSNLQLKDAEEEVRLFAFFDIVKNQTDLANILTKDKDQDNDELDKDAHLKEEALNKALNQIKKQKVITETLGKPVQLLGYRAAGKLDQMVKHFQYITQYGIEKFTQDNSANDIWTANCLLEGPEGIVILYLDFKKTSRKQEEWVLDKVIVKPLVASDTNLIDQSAASNEGVKFVD